MSFLQRNSFLILLSSALLVNIVSISYITTLARQGYSERPFADPNSIKRSLYIGERIGPNIYTAGTPFESRITRTLVEEGCPCPDVAKLNVLSDMITTREFFLNVLFWAFPAFLGALLLRKKWTATRAR